MNEDFSKALQNLLNNNIGNRISLELGNGLYTAIMVEHNKIVEQLSNTETPANETTSPVATRQKFTNPGQASG